MRKLKTPILLLLTAVLLAVGAALPKIVAAVQDHNTIGEATFDTVESIRLNIRQDAPGLAKLAMLYKLDDVIEMSENSASMTREEVEKAAYAALEPYINAGIMHEFEKWNIEARPLLGQVPGQPELMSVFWSVDITGDPDVFYYVGVTIDDETGQLININCTSNYVIEESIREDVLGTFCDIFFTELGIAEYADFATNDLEGQYIGDNAVGIRYRFGDAVYGEINVDFFVHEYGFHIEFPDL